MGGSLRVGDACLLAESSEEYKLNNGDPVPVTLYLHAD